MNEANSIDTSLFQPFPKLARLNREVIVTEKIDGTNAQIFICEPPVDFNIDDPVHCGIWLRKGLLIRAASRTRWITPTNDNYGFAKWVLENADELVKLGPGRHFGEWWGGGVQRGYGLTGKRFSLFNVGRWESSSNEGFPGIFQREPNALGMTLSGPNCCHVVPTIWRGSYDSFDARDLVEMLRTHGSFAAPGFMKPEGIVLYHTAAQQCFKVTLENDEKPKSQVE